MHMLLARSAWVRGMQLVAGMLTHHMTTGEETPAESGDLSEFKLVSWTSNARSRREDELARIRQMRIES
jgi:hypothetical protein